MQNSMSTPPPLFGPRWNEQLYKIDRTHKHCIDAFFTLADHYKQREDYNQRAWSEQQQQAFIDSLLRGAYVPPVVLRKLSESASQNYQILDGVQRTYAIYLFFESILLRVPISLNDVPEFKEYVDCFFNDLPEELQKQVRGVFYPVDIVCGIPALDDEQHEKLAANIFRNLRNRN